MSKTRLDQFILSAPEPLRVLHALVQDSIARGRPPRIGGRSGIAEGRRALLDLGRTTRSALLSYCSPQPPAPNREKDSVSSDITSWLSATPAERTHDRAIERVNHQADLAQTKIAGITRVAQTAMVGALSVSMMKNEAAMISPVDAGKFDLVATTAVMAMASQVQRLV